MDKSHAKLFGCLTFSASLVSCLVLFSPASATDPSSSATATVHVSEACSLTSSVITPHTDNMGNGTYTDSLGSTKFTVKCNDASGFALYAIGYSGDEYGATSMLGDNELSIPTGTDASAGNTTSHWSMKISKDTTSYLPNSLTIENSFNSQHLIPSTYTKIASFPSSTDGINGTGSSILATYGVRISGTQAAGTYIGKVKYTLVHPNMNDNSNKPAEPLPASACPANSICYAPNAADIVGTMVSTGNNNPTLTAISASSIAAKQTKTRIDVSSYSNITSNSTAELIAPNYSRPGYGFAGWSTDFEATNSSIIYGPNETITVGDVSTNGMILYPVWIASTGNLQGADGQGWTGCNALTTASYNSTTGKVEATLASMTALKDTRDNNVYTVARLVDGKCWMVENLRLNAENSRGDANIAKAQGYGDATNSAYGDLGKFIGLADSEDTNFTGSSANSLYSIDGSNDTININSSNFPNYRMPHYNNNNTNHNLTSTYNGTGSFNANTNNPVRWYGYGNYYSWQAAFANTGFYTNYYNANNNESQNSDAAGTSICPKGWKLPLGVESTGNIEQGENDIANRVGGFSYLDRKLGGTGATQSSDSGAAQSKKWRTFPNNLVYSGSFGYSGASGRGISGSYWSSSVRDLLYTYHSGFDINNVDPSYYSEKYYGRAVRCIAQW